MNKTVWIVLGLIIFLIGAFLFSSNREMDIREMEGFATIDVQEGTGATLNEGDIVMVHYVGTLEDGSEFDSSRARNAPFEFQYGVSPMIDGWDEGIAGMKVGGVRHMRIPPEMAYGPAGTGHQLAGETLYFEVELLSIGPSAPQTPPADPNTQEIEEGLREVRENNEEEEQQ